MRFCVCIMGNGRNALYTISVGNESAGYTSSYDPLSQQIAQLVYWAEDYFSVPTILNPATGFTVFIAETEHTDTYDDYCTSSDRITWLIAG